MPGVLLEAPRIVSTIERLHQRIAARFPDSGLSRLCGDLLLTARAAAGRADAFARPIVPIRLTTWVLVVLLALTVVMAVTATGIRWSRAELTDVIQVSEAGLNELVLIGAGLVFLVGWERRLKRSRALRALHELRSVAHVIDMHQLTKDPERLLDDFARTDASPRSTMNAFQLNRYLDYCSELLSLTGKVAAIYVQRFDDPVVLETVAEIEDLTTGLCQKIAHKMNVLQHLGHAVRPSDDGGSADFRCDGAGRAPTSPAESRSP